MLFSIIFLYLLYLISPLVGYCQPTGWRETQQQIHKKAEFTI